MTFTEIYDFIENRMRMSHIYQPVMLMTLLKNKGMASVTKIAESLLMYDHAQVEYYENITKNMVGRVLRNHKIVSKEGKNFVLSGFKSLTESQIEELNLLCQEKLNDHQSNWWLIIVNASKAIFQVAPRARSHHPRNRVGQDLDPLFLGF